MLISINKLLNPVLSVSLICVLISCSVLKQYKLRGEVGIPLTGLTPSYLCAFPKPGPRFPTPYVLVFVFGV